MNIICRFGRYLLDGCLLGLGLWFCLLAWLPVAMAEPALPPLTGRVVDAAHLLDDDTIQRLGSDLAAFEAKTSTQIVIVTLPDLQGYPIEQWGLALLRGWRIGQKDKNNGIVVIVAPHERQMRIETGYGADGPLPDATASLIIRQDMTPLFKQGDYAGGLSAGLRDIEADLQGELHAGATTSQAGADNQQESSDSDQAAADGQATSDESTGSNDPMKWAVGIWFAMAGVLIFVGMRRARKTKGRAGGGSGSRSESGSSSSSDGFSGGGSGGGGGASGSW
jgi:uncharacterized protein